MKLSKKHLVAVILLNISLYGCGGGGDSAKSPPSPPPPPPPVVGWEQHVSAWLQQQQNWLQSIQCPSSDCDPVSLSFAEGQFEPGYLLPQQTVLVLDTDGMDLLSTLTYRHRVKSAWHWNEQAEPVAKALSVTVPKYLPTLYQRLRQLHREKNGPGFVAAQQLSSLEQRIAQLNPNLAQPYTGHGSVALSYLAEHNPQAELVVAQTPDFAMLFRDDFCKGDAAAFRQRIEQASQRFYQQVIQAQDVEYLNWSGGFDLPRTVAVSAQRLCTQPLSSEQQSALLLAYQPFYQMLFHSPKLLGVQAATANFQPSQQQLDALMLPHRVRAGFFNTGTSRSALDPAGKPTGVVPAVPDYQQNSLAVIDVLVNFSFSGLGSSCQPGQFSYKTPSLLGLSYDALCSQQSSWAAPLVLSRLIHLQQSRFAAVAWSDALIADLKAALTPTGCSYEMAGTATLCKLQDPLQHRQLEIVRLGYLP